MAPAASSATTKHSVSAAERIQRFYQQRLLVRHDSAIEAAALSTRLPREKATFVFHEERLGISLQLRKGDAANGYVCLVQVGSAAEALGVPHCAPLVAVNGIAVRGMSSTDVGSLFAGARPLTIEVVPPAAASSSPMPATTRSQGVEDMHAGAAPPTSACVLSGTVSPSIAPPERLTAGGRSWATLGLRIKDFGAPFLTEDILTAAFTHTRTYTCMHTCRCAPRPPRRRHPTLSL